MRTKQDGLSGHMLWASGLLVAFAVLLASPSTGLAQQRGDTDYRWQLFAQGGAVVSSSVSRTVTILFPPPNPALVGSEEATLSRTGRLFTGARYALTDRDEVEVSYTFHRGSVRSLTALPPPGTVGRDSLPVNADYVSFNYVRGFANNGRWQPFATGGVGLALFDVGIETEKKFSGNLGLGLDIEITPRWAFRVENRTFITGAPRGVNAARGGTLFQWVPSAGLVLRF